MQPEIYNRPLKIVHGFPRRAGMTDAEIRASITDKLTELKDKGFGGVVSNVPLHNYTKSAEEWERFRFIAAECERLGLRLWIYDENGYPSGGAGGLTLAEHPDYECTGVVLVTKELAPGETVEMELPRGHRHFLYAALYKTAGGVDGITDFHPVSVLPCHRTAEPLHAENKTDTSLILCAFAEKPLYEGTHAEHNVCDCRRYIDVTYAPAVRAFLENTYEKYYACIPERLSCSDLGGAYPEIGKIEAVFTDEPSLMGCYINAGLYPNSVHDPYDDSIPLYPVISWGHDFEEAFRAQCGYDCLDGLIYKFVKGGADGKQYRLDYHRVLSRLFEESFYRQISDWCAEHHLNFSGHILLEDDIRQHVLFEGNFFSFLRHMHYPGIDMLHSIPEVIYDTYAFTPKLISSIARANGRKHVMSEVSAHAQGGNVTIPQQYASVCLQYAFGVDVFTYYYSESFMDAGTYRKYNDAHGRIDTVMAGETVTDVLVYYPIETFQMHHLGSDAQYGSYTAEENACRASLDMLLDRLISNQIDFDFADSEFLSRCRVENGRIRTPNGHSYAALLLPAMEYTDELSALLSGWNAAGCGILSLSDKAFADAPCGQRFTNPDILLSSLDRSSFAAEKSDCGGRIAMLARDTEAGRAFLFVCADPDDGKIDIVLHGMKSPVLYSPLEDAVIPADITETPDGHRLCCSFSAYDCVIVKER